MTDARFWELVREVDWPSRTGERAEVGKIFLMKRLSPEEAEAMRGHFEARRNQLYRRLEEHESKDGASLELGDDSTDDLLSHIVGLGREAFEAATGDFSLVVKRAHAHDFSESFAYLIPSAKDYDALDAAGYTQRGERLLGEYRASLELPLSEDVKVQIRSMISLLEPMARGDWETFLASEEEGKAITQAISEAVRPLFSGMLLSGGNPLHNPWGVLNLYHDVRTWLLEYHAEPQRAG